MRARGDGLRQVPADGLMSASHRGPTESEVNHEPSKEIRAGRRVQPIAAPHSLRWPAPGPSPAFHLRAGPRALHLPGMLRRGGEGAHRPTQTPLLQDNNQAPLFGVSGRHGGVSRWREIDDKVWKLRSQWAPLRQMSTAKPSCEMTGNDCDNTKGVRLGRSFNDLIVRTPRELQKGSRCGRRASLQRLPEA